MCISNHALEGAVKALSLATIFPTLATHWYSASEYLVF